MTQEVVTPEEVAKISAISPVHRLTVESFLESGRWVLTRKGADKGADTMM